MDRRAPLAWCALALASCASPAPRTQVIATIEAEPGLASQLASVMVRVTTLPDREERLSEMVLPAELPATVALAPRGGDSSRRFEISANGTLPAATVETLVTSGYVSGRTLWLRIVLRDRCRMVRCTEDIDPATLPSWPGAFPDAGPIVAGDGGVEMDVGLSDAQTLDATRPDAQAIDVGPPDAGSDVGSSCTQAECDALEQCEQELVCTGGVCVEMAPPCADPTPDDCTTRACVGPRCLQFDLSDGDPCSDGNLCTTNDRCTGGSCGGDPTMVSCGRGEACDPMTGACGCTPSNPVRCGAACYPQCCPGTRSGSSCGMCGRNVCDAGGTWDCVPDPAADLAFRPARAAPRRRTASAKRTLTPTERTPSYAARRASSRRSSTSPGPTS